MKSNSFYRVQVRVQKNSFFKLEFKFDFEVAALLTRVAIKLVMLTLWLLMQQWRSFPCIYWWHNLFCFPPGAPLGMITWYPVHPTNMNFTNLLINSDNKGRASMLVEKRMRKEGETQTGKVGWGWAMRTLMCAMIGRQMCSNKVLMQVEKFCRKKEPSKISTCPVDYCTDFGSYFGCERCRMVVPASLDRFSNRTLKF